MLYNSSAVVPQITYTEELLLDYRWFDAKNITPQYEFGYGQSYTSFNYTELAIDMKNSTEMGLYENIGFVSFVVENSGAMDGNEVSQLYLGFPASAEEPPKILRGFERTFIKKCETANVTINLRRKDISIW